MKDTTHLPPYHPLGDCKRPGIAEVIQEARQRIANMDNTDGSGVGEWHPELALRTVLSALSAGISGDDLSCIADAYVMVQQIEFASRRD